MLTMAFGESNMSNMQVQLWYNRFKEDREDINNDARSGCPNTSITDGNTIERLMMMLAYCSALVRQFLRMF